MKNSVQTTTKFCSQSFTISYFTCDLFFFVSDSNITSFADGNTPYLVKKELFNILNELEKDLEGFKEVFLKELSFSLEYR